jgi:hypothetical protein
MLFGLKLVEKYVIQNNTSCSVYKKWCAQPKKKSADCEKSNNSYNPRFLTKSRNFQQYTLSAYFHTLHHSMLSYGHQTNI